MQRQLIAQRIRCVKNEWFKGKAIQIEHEMEKGMGGHGMWQNLSVCVYVIFLVIAVGLTVIFMVLMALR